MSFYGNTYYLATESFTQFVLKNLGLNNYTFPDSGKIITTEVSFDARNRQDGLRINTGNHWLTMTQADDNFGNPGNGVTLWHNKPATKNLIGIDCFGPVREVDIPVTVDKSKIPYFNFDEYIKVPMITYDEAGHISEAKASSFYRMPKNPIPEVQDDINDIYSKLDAINGDSPSSLKSQLNKAINDYSTAANDITKAEKAAEDAKKASEDAKKASEDALKEVTTLSYAIEGIVSALEELKKKHGMT